MNYPMIFQWIEPISWEGRSPVMQSLVLLSLLKIEEGPIDLELL